MMMAETTVPYPKDDPKDCTRVYQTLLVQARLPAVVIDSSSAEIVAANAPGLAVLGLAPTSALPLQLDKAMPAIAVLREVSAATNLKPVERALVFRSHDAIALLTCNLAIAHESQPSHVLVVFHDTQTPMAATTNEGLKPAPPATEPAQLTSEDVTKLAHELKTPLAAIAAAAEIMRDERLGAIGNAQYQGYAADIHDSAAHAIAVIDNLLSAKSNEQEKAQRTRPDTFNLSDLAARTLSALEPFANARGLRLVHDDDQQMPVLSADVTAVRQILLNLLSNAIKFTPAGGEIHVTTRSLLNSASSFSVRDTGIGMDEMAMVNALADNEMAGSYRPGGGQGIGLSLVRRLAAENGATLKIDSTPGHGTIVSVTFDRPK